MLGRLRWVCAGDGSSRLLCRTPGGVHWARAKPAWPTPRIAFCSCRPPIPGTRPGMVRAPYAVEWACSHDRLKPISAPLILLFLLLLSHERGGGYGSIKRGGAKMPSRKMTSRVLGVYGAGNNPGCAVQVGPTRLGYDYGRGDGWPASPPCES